MKHMFEAFINSYLENDVGIASEFLSEELAHNLSENLLKLRSLDLLKNAGTGNEQSILIDNTVRKDRIYWLDRNHNDTHENDFFDLMDKFVAYLNQTCYTGITSYEFHYALYENGSFYKRHIDQFKNNDSRQFSMITYLNVAWKDTDGGELVVYHDHFEQHITPTNRKSVFFKSSDLEHEVLVTNVARLSITGWLKR
jgi:SM-20-related protein